MAGTILVLLILAVIVGLDIKYLYKNRKTGGCTDCSRCGGACGSCHSADGGTCKEAELYKKFHEKQAKANMSK